MYFRFFNMWMFVDVMSLNLLVSLTFENQSEIRQATKFNLLDKGFIYLIKIS